MTCSDRHLSPAQQRKADMIVMAVFADAVLAIDFVLTQAWEAFTAYEEQKGGDYQPLWTEEDRARMTIHMRLLIDSIDEAAGEL